MRHAIAIEEKHEPPSSGWLNRDRSSLGDVLRLEHRYDEALRETGAAWPPAASAKPDPIQCLIVARLSLAQLDDGDARSGARDSVGQRDDGASVVSQWASQSLDTALCVGSRRSRHRPRRRCRTAAARSDRGAQSAVSSRGSARTRGRGRARQCARRVGPQRRSARVARRDRAAAESVRFTLCGGSHGATQRIGERATGRRTSRLALIGVRGRECTPSFMKRARTPSANSSPRSCRHRANTPAPNARTSA